MIPTESSVLFQNPRPSGLIERTVIRWLMRPVRVSAVTVLSAHFRFIDLEGEALKGCGWSVGQKIQIKLDGGLLTRTFTPLYWDEKRGSTRILAYAHGCGPGSDWVRGAAPGTECQLFGPRRSMGLENLPSPIVLFGDETSFGLAAALQARLNQSHEIRPVFEVSSLKESKPVLDNLGIDADLIERRPDDGHWVTVMRVIESLTDAATHFVLSGKAQSIQFVGRVLKQRGIPTRRLRAKAHWAPGKKGLD